MGCEMKHCRVPSSRSERIILVCQPLNFKNFSTPEAPFQGSSILHLTTGILTPAPSPGTLGGARIRCDGTRARCTDIRRASA